MMLNKQVTINVGGFRVAVFFALFTAALVGVIFWILTSSCSYTDNFYSEEHCDPSYFQIGQPLTLCKNESCYDTQFYSNNFIQYKNIDFSGCVANVTAVKILTIYELPSWTSINSNISCDGGYSLYIKDISTRAADPFNHIMTDLENSLPYYSKGSVLIRIYSNEDGPSINFNYVNGTKLNDSKLTFDVLTNFENNLAAIVTGSYAPYGYICHNCLSGKGSFNSSFIIKFFTSLFSLMSTIFNILMIVCTFKITSDYFELKKYELLSSEPK